MRATGLLSNSAGAIFLVGILVATSPAFALSGCNVRYSITPLDTITGMAGVVSMNNRGQVVGFVFVEGPPGDLTTRAFIWSRDDPVMRELGDLDGPATFAFDINDLGTVAGASDTPDGAFHAARWRGDEGDAQDLGTLGGSFSVAYGINNWGFIVGRAESSAENFDDAEHAFLWSPINGEQRDLGTLGGRDSEAHAINNWGQVVGWSSVGEGEIPFAHAFLWSPSDPDHMRDLGTLGGENSYATAINDRGQVAGYSDTGPDGALRHAFFWSEGRMQDLGTLGGGESSADGVNIWGQVVGSSDTRAFIWTEVCGMRDLNTVTLSSSSPPPALTSVVINDLGEMVAGSPHQWYLLKPILWPWRTGVE